MSGELRRASEELRIIRRARRNGRKLRIEPMLTDSPCIRVREAHLSAFLGEGRS